MNNKLDDKKLLAIALEKYSTPYGKPNPQTYAFIDGVKSKLNNTVEDKWISVKPEFKEECTFITATKYNRNNEDLYYEYSCWQIKKLDGEDENGNPAWYFGLLNGEGEEWGALEDLGADYYLIIPEVGK